jgi:protein-tyrosine phosphatase
MSHTVLFVCTGNYYRSRYAELLFTLRKPAALDWMAESRGLQLSPENAGPISVAVIRRMINRGLPVPNVPREPLSLTRDDLLRASRIIALDADEHPPYVQRLFPEWVDRFEYWEVADLDRATADDALALIERKVDALIGALVEQHP